MKKVKVIGFCAEIGAGNLRLTDEQAKPRLTAGLIAPTDKEGVYQIVSLNQFKQGEVFGYDGELSPVTLEDMAPVKDAAKQEAEAEAAALAAKQNRYLELLEKGEEVTEDEVAELAALKDALGE